MFKTKLFSVLMNILLCFILYVRMVNICREDGLTVPGAGAEAGDRAGGRAGAGTGEEQEQDLKQQQHQQQQQQQQ